MRRPAPGSGGGSSRRGQTPPPSAPVPRAASRPTPLDDRPGASSTAHDEGGSSSPRSFASDRRPFTQGGDYVGLSRLYGLVGGLALVAVRVLGALVNPVADCDETYNYWEPMHYLVAGSGMQTWEYSPLYTLRSYAYLLPHAAVAKAVSLALSLVQRPLVDKTLVFYAVRIMLGLVSAACEATFVDGVTRRLGPRPGALTFLILLTSAGVLQASTAMLPSTAASYLVMLATANWLTRKLWWATFFAVAAVLALGWPFVALLFVPLALHVLYDVCLAAGSPAQGALRVLAMGLSSAALVLPPVLLVDRWFYRRWAFPALNILLYNVGGGPEGADDTLYGVEPWTFYAKNLLLNFNVAFPLALLLPLALLALPWPDWSRKAKAEALVFVSPAFLWLGVMTLRPHKEERFLFPIYPLLALGAALTVHGVITALLRGAAWARKKAGAREVQPHALLGRLFASAARLVGPTVVLVHLVLGVSRTVSMAGNFAAPLALFGDFSREQRVARRGEILQWQRGRGEDPAAKRPALVCMGNEWYRFPSSFFLPHDGVRLAFVRSGFKAQLPQPFRPEDGTWAPPLQPFNQYNREEPSRYVPIHACRYLVELFPPPPPGSSYDHHYDSPQQRQRTKKGAAEKGEGGGAAAGRAMDEDDEIVHNQPWLDERLWELGEARPVAWTVLRHYPLLDKDSSPSPYRAFWLPWLSHRKVHYGAFTLLEREEEDDFDPSPEASELGFL